MHAVVFRVTINDREKGEAFLKEQIVPTVSQAPGFVAGYWVNLGDQGTSMIVFESEDAARQAMEQGGQPPAEAVTIESMDGGEVIAHVSGAAGAEARDARPEQPEGAPPTGSSPPIANPQSPPYPEDPSGPQAPHV